MIGGLGPTLAGLADSSLTPACAAVYRVMEKNNKIFSAHLLIGKCRLTALHGSTIPKTELQALVILCRRHLKVWGVMFTCLTTKAVTILACPGYDTETFGIYGKPTKMNMDHGPQIRAHAETETLYLDRVAAEASRRGTQWIFSPKACRWHHAWVLAKVCMRLARHSLAHTLSSALDLDYHRPS